MAISYIELCSYYPTLKAFQNKFEVYKIFYPLYCQINPHVVYEKERKEIHL